MQTKRCAEMHVEPIPYSFLRERVNLSWFEALWGYERKLMGWSALVELAAHHVESGSDSDLELELAGLTKSEAHLAGDLLRKLAEHAPEEERQHAERKWLYLVLSWLFENKDSLDDPLGEVEMVYADFDYPKDVAEFVRYMPASDGWNPNLHTADQNRRRLFEKWKDYVDSLRSEFAAAPRGLANGLVGD